MNDDWTKVASVWAALCKIFQLSHEWLLNLDWFDRFRSKNVTKINLHLNKNQNLKSCCDQMCLSLNYDSKIIVAYDQKKGAGKVVNDTVLLLFDVIFVLFFIRHEKKRASHERDRQSDCLKIIIPVNFNNERHFTAISTFRRIQREKKSNKYFIWRILDRTSLFYSQPRLLRSDRDIPNWLINF